ncbi:MAG: hypothetical protein IKE89_05815 [Bacilli bacterium]|nr:hypothetical protein [Bacilli bacterium]
MNYTDQNGNVMNIEAIKIFKIDELGKEYIIYSIMDNDDSNPDGELLFGEIIRNDDSIQILGILPNEENIVIAYYNEIKNQLGGSNE